MNIRSNEDLVQEALLVVREKYRTIEFQKGILPWAYTILDNILRDDYKTETRRSNILNEQSKTLLEIYGNDESIENEFEKKNLGEALERALGQLNNREKHIFRLKLQGFPGEEIRKQVGLKRSAFDVTVYRGVKKLRKILINEGAI